MNSEQFDALKWHLKEVCSSPDFAHHKWFIKWHLEIVERLALELCEHYPDADKDLVTVMAWMHDYGKIMDSDNQNMMTMILGREKLVELGFASDFVAKAIENIESMDKSQYVDLSKSPIEVQIVASADGCAHWVGPYMKVLWHEATDKTNTGKTYEELMKYDLEQVENCWKHMVVLPEARAAFQVAYEVTASQSGKMPEKFFS